jgi:hypothetical protein
MNGEKQDCKIGTGWGVTGGGEGEGRRLRWGYKVNGLHTPIWNTTKKPFAIALNGVGRGLGERQWGQCK